METQAVRDASARLLLAYDKGEPMAPVIESFPEATVADAYRIQQEQVREWVAGGDVVKGHKVGLASRAMQEQMGVDQPDYGHLLAGMFHLEHQPIDAGSFLQPRIEPEIAFVLGRRLTGPGVTVADAIRAVDFVVPALEIVASRITDWKISIVDTIADNASSGGVVLGSKPTALSDVDLRLVGCTLQLGGELVATGAGAAVLGSPINALVWLANTIGPLGIDLEPGHVVLPGSMTRAYPVRAGDTVVADMGALGTVTAVFAE
ncbi:2-keto-4-pentenoate hydratase [Amycolatopsis acidiphila]|uniref:2-keto-4-pentenoate hydratase n=1 Tax=Amycolatopsis acidiphila TaxID=715473 RepID=A0A558AH91_9PSEU|nr:2-keto-4-pentenoate hydratase [Amycolatopsis acidiphila]TVT23635.1 2-keto-4-pentenoate hydratase [Amycolatopsis acidiphila]UIJ58622.1 2-keto-4-pentenoate hydratase [Amycolatopsis acidiphila]GHG76431.1 2-keto-4-pentenoate hydratase [Amycolatopsis acidiphila]